MDERKCRICVVAVDVRSAHNVGSFFRTCDGFGAELYLVGITPHPRLSTDVRLPHVAKKAEEAIAKTALGAEKTVTWRYASTFQECVDELRSDGFTVCALEQHETSKSLEDMSISQDTALVVGREVEGLYAHEIAACDEVYEIPMIGKKESFNVAVSVGIGLYQATNSSQNSKPLH
jgi:tRNA G18 (ribose-2'-O)-methylase SpoU